MKKLLSIILAVCLVLSVVVFANAEYVPDTTVHQSLTSMIEEPPTVYQFGRFMYYFDFIQYILCGYDIDNSNVGGVINPDADNAYEEAYEGEIVIPDKLHIRDVSSYPPDEVVESGPNMPADGYISFGKIDRSFYSSIKNSLKKLTLPSTLTDFAIHYVPNTVECITVNDNHPSLSVENNILFNKDKTQIVFFPRTFSGEYTIPDTVTSIGKYCFMDCSELTKVTVPQGVETIDSCAFLDCTKLTDISLSATLHNVLNRAFCNTGYWNDATNWDDGSLYIGPVLIQINPELTSYTVKEGTTVIAQYAATEENLTNITLPQGIKALSSHAFYNATALTQINLPSSLRYVGDYVFSYCDKLEGLVLPNMVNWVGYRALPNSYYDVSNFDKNGFIYNGDHLLAASQDLKGVVTLTKETRTISPRAFYGCNKITELKLQKSVCYIGDKAFYNMSNLKYVFFHKLLKYVSDDIFNHYVTAVGYPDEATQNLLNKEPHINTYIAVYLDGRVGVNEYKIYDFNVYSERITGKVKIPLSLFDFKISSVLPEATTKFDNVTIKGYVKSPAEEIAKDNNLTFEKMYYYGDLSGDFEIKAEDALLVLHASVEKIALNQDESILADVDGDGDATASDALAVLQKSVGAVKRFEVEK